MAIISDLRHENIKINKQEIIKQREEIRKILYEFRKQSTEIENQLIRMLSLLDELN